MRNQLLKEQPTKEFLNQFVKIYGLVDINDAKKFSRNTLLRLNTLDKITDFMPDLLKYYLPCKVEQYLTDLTEKKAITILRQLVREQGYKVISQEKYVDSKKILLYSLEPEFPENDNINYELKIIEF